MSSLGDQIKLEGKKWTFSGDVHHTFDDHVSKSVPSYLKGHDLIVKLSDYFIQENSFVYDIGCSTGTLLQKLYRHHQGNGNFIGLDIEPNMISECKSRSDISSKINFFCISALEYEFEKSDLMTAYYTMQFVRPNVRQRLFDIVYENLNWGGAFIFFEKAS